jgi:hypothetical protein
MLMSDFKVLTWEHTFFHALQFEKDKPQIFLRWSTLRLNACQIDVLSYLLCYKRHKLNTVYEKRIVLRPYDKCECR